MSPSAILPEAQRNGTTKVLKDLDASAMIKELVPESEQGKVPALNDPGRMAQKYSTAHMVLAKWTAEGGWEAPKMQRYGLIALEPTASVLHYATESFVSLNKGDRLISLPPASLPFLISAKLTTS